MAENLKGTKTADNEKEHAKRFFSFLADSNGAEQDKPLWSKSS